MDLVVNMEVSTTEWSKAYILCRRQRKTLLHEVHQIYLFKVRFLVDLKKYICSERVMMSDQISGVAETLKSTKGILFWPS